MKVRAHESAPAVVGSHDTIDFRFLVTAVVASVSAAVMYCSASAGETCSAVALLSKPSLNSSVGKVLAGPVVSPRRSRTVLLYSNRFSLRRKVGPGARGAVAH